MPSALETLANKLDALLYLLPEFAAVAAAQHADAFADANRQQLLAGQDSNGAPIQPAYKPITVLIKALKGQPTDRVTLKDTGAFQASISAVVLEDGVYLVATDAKTDDLAFKYGEAVLGLTPSNVGELIEEQIRPSVETQLRDYLST